MIKSSTAGNLLLASLLAAGGIAACFTPNDNLTPGSTAGTPPPTTDGANGVDGTSPTNPPGDVGTVTIHRLNASEYDNTVRDLLGDTSHPAAAFPPDDGAESFTNNADALTISPTLCERYEAAA